MLVSVIRKLLSVKIPAMSVHFYSNRGTRDKQGDMHESIALFSMVTIIAIKN